MKRVILFLVALLLLSCNQTELSTNYTDNAQLKSIKQQTINKLANDSLTKSVKKELPVFADLLEILVPKEGQKAASWEISDDREIIKLNTPIPQKGNGDIRYITGNAIVYLNNDSTQEVTIKFTLYGNSMENYNAVYFSHYDVYSKSPIVQFMDCYRKVENQQDIEITETQKGGGSWAGIFEIKIRGKTPIIASYGWSQNGSDGTPSSIHLELSF